MGVSSDSASSRLLKTLTSARKCHAIARIAGFRSLVDGSEGEHYLAAALANRRRVLDRQIGDRLRSHAFSEAY